MNSLLEALHVQTKDVLAAASKYTMDRYAPDCRAERDGFIDAGKNATFIFRRDCMDCHADRFEDHSLALRKDGQIATVLPAKLRPDGVFVSHQGLIYAGFVLRRDAMLASVSETVEYALAFLQAVGVAELVYKRMPRFYNTLPHDAIDYALFMLEAKLARSDCSLVVCRADRLPVGRGKTGSGARLAACLLGPAEP
jgi:hypothetical protein